MRNNVNRKLEPNGGAGMRKLVLVVLLVLVVGATLLGCSTSDKGVVVGKWKQKDTSRLGYTDYAFYKDGTFTRTWQIAPSLGGGSTEEDGNWELGSNQDQPAIRIWKTQSVYVPYRIISRNEIELDGNAYTRH